MATSAASSASCASASLLDSFGDIAPSSSDVVCWDPPKASARAWRWDSSEAWLTAPLLSVSRLWVDRLLVALVGRERRLLPSSSLSLVSGSLSLSVSLWLSASRFSCRAASLKCMSASSSSNAASL